MAEGFGIKSTPGVQSSAAAASSHAAESAAQLPKAPAKQANAAPSTTAQPTTFSSEPAVPTHVQSKVVARLLQQNATVYAPGLARVPLPPRPEDAPRTAPKKPAGPMVAPRTLDAGRSPLAPSSLLDARSSIDAIGELPGLANAQDVSGFWNDRLDALEAALDGGVS